MSVRIVKALATLFTITKFRVTWLLMLASRKWRASRSQKPSPVIYAAGKLKSPLVKQPPGKRSECPECEAMGRIQLPSTDLRIAPETKMCGCCGGMGTLSEFEKSILERRQRDLMGFSPGQAEFIGGPLDGQLHAMSEPLPRFYWAQALPMDWAMVNQEAEPDTLPQIDEYTYERQFFFSSIGSLVYLCVE